VAAAARPYWDQWFGNPSSAHAYGKQPRRAVARAREQVAALVGAAASEIVFTGSGSEADQLAIRGAVLAGLRAMPGSTSRVVTQATEHPAVLACCEALERWHSAQVLAATPGVAASTGSACHSGQHSPSPVLTAMGPDEARALAAIRLSVGRWTTEADIDTAAGQLAGTATRLAKREHRMTPTASGTP
jgi:cysteine sulfinate desulfinase/cysteine desulfurase-like protein